MLIQHQPKRDMLLTISSQELFHSAGSSLGIVLAEGEGRLSAIIADGQMGN